MRLLIYEAFTKLATPGSSATCRLRPFGQPTDYLCRLSIILRHFVNAEDAVTAFGNISPGWRNHGTPKLRAFVLRRFQTCLADLTDRNPLGDLLVRAEIPNDTVLVRCMSNS